ARIEKYNDFSQQLEQGKISYVELQMLQEKKGSSQKLTREEPNRLMALEKAFDEGLSNYQTVAGRMERLIHAYEAGKVNERNPTLLKNLMALVAGQPDALDRMQAEGREDLALSIVKNAPALGLSLPSVNAWNNAHDPASFASVAKQLDGHSHA